MACQIVKGMPHIYGFSDDIEIHPDIDGQVRLKMRNDDFMKMYIRTQDGISQWTVIRKDGFLSPGVIQGRNVRFKG